MEALTQRPALPVKDKKGKRALLELEGALKAKKRPWCSEGIPTLEVGKVFLRLIEVSTSEAVRTANKALGMADKAAEIAKEVLKVPSKGARFTDKVAEVAEVDCGTIAAVDQVASVAHKASSDASNSQWKCRGYRQVACKEEQGYQEVPIEGDESETVGSI